MEIQSAFNAGVQGFQRATATANQAATDIVKQTEPVRQEQLQAPEQRDDAQEATERVADNENTPSLTDSVVKLKVSEFQAQASAKVIQSADDALGTLIDVKV